jgi:hypothetical protein
MKPGKFWNGNVRILGNSQQIFGLLVAVCFLGAKIFVLWQKKKKREKKIHCKLYKGIFGKKKTHKTQHILRGKKKG